MSVDMSVAGGRGSGGWAICVTESKRRQNNILKLKKFKLLSQTKGNPVNNCDFLNS
jgi:hypothetical protein